MGVLGIIFTVAGSCFLLFGSLFAAVTAVLTHFSSQTGKTSGRLIDAKQKNNVTLYRKQYHRPLRKTGFARHMTNGVYLYAVEDKIYRIRMPYFGTMRQTPLFVPVVYWKRFPRFAYIDTIESFSGLRYLPHTLVCLLCAVILIPTGILIL